MNFRDVRRLAIESRNYSNISKTTDLESLAKIVSNVELNKPTISESNWEARTLSHEHIVYACLDAYASFCVGHKLLMG